ncbi:MAG: hypothetical protein ACK520_09425 [Inhella sp.]|jgi:hypothetical protein|uniref:hypothetical protein n=1 Tax=Inhella sp. TaxID=1921806 RepID=UPI0022BB2A1F|nr:hypothetical protein [Inhella sp.]MCZ8235946.1 hypothetical protein [Inhella sp.]
MSKANLEARVEALEQAATIEQERRVMMVCFVDAGAESREMTRAEVGRATFERHPSETEAEFMARIEAEVLKTEQEGHFTLAFLHAH